MTILYTSKKRSIHPTGMLVWQAVSGGGIGLGGIEPGSHGYDEVHHHQQYTL